MRSRVRPARDWHYFGLAVIARCMHVGFTGKYACRPQHLRSSVVREATLRKKPAAARENAIVHAVVAMEVLHWHEKLTAIVAAAFRRQVGRAVSPRLERQTTYESGVEDFRISGGRVVQRASRILDPVLQQQPTLGNVVTMEILAKLGQIGQQNWLPLARLRTRRELSATVASPDDDPQAKELPAWCQAWVASKANGAPAAGTDLLACRDRAVGHGSMAKHQWVLPVFVEHDRSFHAERQALLLLLQRLPLDRDERVSPASCGSIRIYASHTPCISCLSSMCQFSRAFPGAKLEVGFDVWKQTKGWIGTAVET